MPQFTDAEKERIRTAVMEAEERTAGEIVPYIVPRSGRYDVAIWRGASSVALLALVGVMLAQTFYTGWGLSWLFTSEGVAITVLVAGCLGAVAAAYVPAVTRWLTGEELLARAVHQRAMQAFVEEEVFNTRDRTGILLFISMMEHRIEVLGDTGINQQVDENAWADIVLDLREAIRSGHMTDGIVEAIRACGALLERSGVEIRPDDTDELPNRLRIDRGRQE